MIGVGERERLSEWVSEESSLSEESSINSTGAKICREEGSESLGVLLSPPAPRPWMCG